MQYHEDDEFDEDAFDRAFADDDDDDDDEVAPTLESEAPRAANEPPGPGLSVLPPLMSEVDDLVRGYAEIDDDDDDDDDRFLV